METHSSFQCLYIGFRKLYCSLCCIKGFVYSPREFYLGFLENHLETPGNTIHSDAASLTTHTKAKAAEIILGVYTHYHEKTGSFHEGNTTY